MLKSKDDYPQKFILLHHQLKSIDKDKICPSKDIILLYSKFLDLVQKMIRLKILTPSQSSQSPQWIVMAPGFKILEDFNALW